MTDTTRLEELEETIEAMSDDTITEWLDHYKLPLAGSHQQRITRLISHAHQSDKLANEIIYD